MGWDGAWGWLWAGSWGGYAADAPAPAAPNCIKTRRFRILGQPISTIVALAFKGKLLPVTLVRACRGTPTPGNIAGSTNVETHTFTAEGFPEEYDERLQPDMVKASARKVVLIAGSIKGEGYTWVVPEQGDRVTIEGKVYAVERVESDPAAATYTLHGKKA